MKKVIWSAIILVVVLLWNLPESITLPFFHLIILGVIPGTNYELGLIFPLILIIVAMVFLIRWTSQVSGELIEFKTQLARAEEAEAENQAVIRTGETVSLAMNEEIDIISI